MHGSGAHGGGHAAEPLKALFLLPDASGPTARFRGRAWIEPLGEHGVRAEAVVWPEAGSARRALLGRLDAWDTVVLVRRLPAIGDAVRMKTARRLHYDFDDAVDLKETNGRGGLSLARWAKLRATLWVADTVTAANETLRERVVDVQPTTRVLPALVDCRRYAPRAGGDGAGPPVLGWMGSRSNLPYLRSIYGPLTTLAKKRIPFVFRVVCDQPPQEPPVPVDYRPWSEAGEAAELQGFDVGLAPLVDDRWTRAKSSVKVLLYQAAGLPVIASPVGEQRALVREGESGFLPTTGAAWEQALIALAKDGELRRRQGAAGRRSVEATRDLRAWVPQMMEVLGLGHG